MSLIVVPRWLPPQFSACRMGMITVFTSLCGAFAPSLSPCSSARSASRGQSSRWPHRTPLRKQRILGTNCDAKVGQTPRVRSQAWIRMCSTVRPVRPCRMPVRCLLSRHYPTPRSSEPDASVACPLRPLESIEDAHDQLPTTSQLG